MRDSPNDAGYTPTISPRKRAGWTGASTTLALSLLLTGALWSLGPRAAACWRRRGCGLQANGARPVFAPPMRPPQLPWTPLFLPAELRRGIADYGSGYRLQRVAAKLLAGQPIKAVTLGGSVTRGAGASSPDTAYAERFFAFINATWPHSGHVFSNKGIGGSSSALFSLCADRFVPADADLVVLEFTYNEAGYARYTVPPMRGFEALLRTLLRLPERSTALLLLHHYAWWHSHGDGVRAGLYYRQAESQLSTLAQFYDVPVLALRAAAYPLLQADVPPFRSRAVTKPGAKGHTGKPLPQAEAGREGDYLFSDSVHPNDVGHQALAELLAAAMLQAAGNVQAATSQGGEEPPRLSDVLQPPMIPGTTDAPTMLCAMQDDLKPLVTGMHGFAWRAERPAAATIVEQKWGYSGMAAGDWVELEVDTTTGAPAAGARKQKEEGGDGKSTLFLGYLRSYEGMGAARVECVAGCTCKPSIADGCWHQRVSLTQIHAVKVSQHPACRIRLTISSGDDDGGGGSSGKEGSGAGSKGGGGGRAAGSKFQLSSLMISSVPLELHSSVVVEAGAL